MPAILGSIRLQLRLLRLDSLLALISVPVLTAALVMIFRAAGRTDLQSFALVAPVLVGIFNMSLFVSSEIVTLDRNLAILELQISSPAELYNLISARVLTVTLISTAAAAESLLVARLFDIDVRLYHAGAAILGLVATAFATAGTAALLSVVFVVTKAARLLQSSLSYPIVLLSGALVPVTLQPDWLQPVSRFIFLSWSADLLRGSLQRREIEVLGPVLALVVLGSCSFLLGALLMRRIIDRLRSTGTIALA